jgi:hypothetical protein
MFVDRVAELAFLNRVLAGSSGALRPRGRDAEGA